MGLQRLAEPAGRERLGGLFGFLLAIIVLLLEAPAGAHSFLVSSSPQPGERLEGSPSAVRLRFTEPLVPDTERIEIRTAGGRAIPAMAGAGAGSVEVRVPLAPLEEGVYVVSWHVRSAVDGHEEVGEFAFGVGSRGRIPDLRSERGGLAWPQAAARWLSVGGLLFAFGGLASERWVWAAVARRRGLRAPALPVRSLLLLALVGSLFELLLLTREAPTTAPLAGASAWASALATPVGAFTVLQAIAAAYGLWLTALPRTRGWSLIPLATGIVAVAATSHAGSAGPGWAVPANALHLGAVAFWVGGLGQLVLATNRLRGDAGRAALLEGVGRYAARALWTVLLVVSTGALVALARLSRPSDLIDTSYGRLLMAKATLVAAALALALAARTRVLRRGRVRLLRRLVAPEAACLVAALALAAALATSPPPGPRVNAASILGPPPMRGPVLRSAGLSGSPLAVHLAAAPGRLQLRIVEPSREPAADATVEISGRAPDGTEIGISPRPCGAGCFATAFRWKDGTTELTVTTSSRRWGRGAVGFSVNWPPGRKGDRLLRRVIHSMREQPRLHLIERVTSGPAGWSTTTASLSGERFMKLELYAVGGGATDIRVLPGPGGRRAITLFMPGSWIWHRLEVDRRLRLRRETIVSPGHLIERSFRNPPGG